MNRKRTTPLLPPPLVLMLVLLGSFCATLLLAPVDAALSCEGICGSFAEHRECYCDGYCLTTGDCCDDFEIECDVHVLSCKDSNECLFNAGGPKSCADFANMGPDSCVSNPVFAKCCAVSCNECRSVQGATLARRLAGNGQGGDVCVDEGALVCPGACNGHGECDYANGHCNCFDGWGSSSDIAMYKSPDCSQRICPAGPSWSALPTASNAGHPMTECSNRGHCDRATGQCRCKEGYTGDACQRTRCFNDCSGHGTCINMRMYAKTGEITPPQTANYSYGDEATSASWDAEQIFGCLCSSSWPTGLGDGETQESEFFGPDCSQRHCPSGDDPGTRNITETDCEGINGGEEGNLCQVDCSNRGVCDFADGSCKCTDGYTGLNCGIKVEYG